MPLNHQIIIITRPDNQNQQRKYQIEKTICRRKMGKNKNKRMKQQLKRQEMANHYVLSHEMVVKLGDLKPGDTVAVMTLFGSLCPITLGHVAAFEEGRKLLLGETQRPSELEDFDLVLGFISLNPDSYVARKFQQGDGPSLSFDERTELIQLATSNHKDWMGIEDWEGCALEKLIQVYPKLIFIHFYLNGADDVIKYRKYNLASEHNRYLTMGRPGFTETLLLSMTKNNVNPAHFIVGPELESISSTQARTAFENRDMKELDRLLHPTVIQWYLERESRWKRGG